MEYYCHSCQRAVALSSTDIVCGTCNGGFIEPLEDLSRNQSAAQANNAQGTGMPTATHQTTDGNHVVFGFSESNGSQPSTQQLLNLLSGAQFSSLGGGRPVVSVTTARAGTLMPRNSFPGSALLLSSQPIGGRRQRPDSPTAGHNIRHFTIPRRVTSNPEGSSSSSGGEGNGGSLPNHLTSFLTNVGRILTNQFGEREEPAPGTTPTNGTGQPTENPQQRVNRLIINLHGSPEGIVMNVEPGDENETYTHETIMQSFMDAIRTGVNNPDSQEMEGTTEQRERTRADYQSIINSLEQVLMNPDAISQTGQGFRIGINPGQGIFDSIFRLIENFDEQSAAAMNRLSDEEIATVPEILVNDLQVKNESQCTTCMENFKLDERVLCLSCKHIFHPDCLTPWLKAHRTCPVCRSVIDPKEFKPKKDNDDREPRNYEDDIELD
uniref:RING-type E3 ubiquitin transferase n=1 Tax=Rhabditophanes sp. KR3021 TaxID=114890 RepID=A0AC35UDZ8_9BILA